MSENGNDGGKTGQKKGFSHAYLGVIAAIAIVGIAYLIIVHGTGTSTHTTSTISALNATTTITTVLSGNKNATGYIYCVATRAAVPHNQTYYAALYANGSIGQWKNTTPYPYYRYGMACFDYNNSEIYCFPAGKVLPANTSFDLKVIYHASLSANGIGSWIAATPYPIPKSETLCAPYGNYVYCAGDGDVVGNFGVMPNINGTKTYYASISANGIGNWMETTPYPVPLFAAGTWPQAPYNGYIYSTGNGWHNATVGTTYENRTYYAQIMQNGSLGQWNIIPSTFPSVASGGCFSYNSTYYCFGPFSGSGTLTYYAKILPNHTLGPWNESEPLPEQHQAVPCNMNSYTGFVYCLGNGYGLVLNSIAVSNNAIPAGLNLTDRTVSWYAKLTPNGMQNWTETTHYPVPLAYAMCVAKQV